MTPDNRGYYKFNRIRGLSFLKFGMTHVGLAINGEDLDQRGATLVHIFVSEGMIIIDADRAHCALVSAPAGSK
jgi:hypothetical protein